MKSTIQINASVIFNVLNLIPRPLQTGAPALGYLGAACLFLGMMPDPDRAGQIKSKQEVSASDRIFSEAVSLLLPPFDPFLSLHKSLSSTGVTDGIRGSMRTRAATTEGRALNIYNTIIITTQIQILLI